MEQYHRKTIEFPIAPTTLFCDFPQTPGIKTRTVSLLTIRINARTFHEEVKQNFWSGESCHAHAAQPRLPTTGSKSWLLPTRNNNISCLLPTISNNISLPRDLICACIALACLMISRASPEWGLSTPDPEDSGKIHQILASIERRLQRLYRWQRI